MLKNKALISGTALCTLLLASCSVEGVYEPENEKTYSVTAIATLPDVWQPTNSVQTRAGEDANFAVMLFKSDGTFCDRKGKQMSDLGQQNLAPFKPKEHGDYVLYAVTNLTINEFPKTTNGLTLDDIYLINTPKDITLGKKEFTIDKGTENYTINIATSHIAAKASFRVTGVPSFTETLTVTLSEQATGFKLDGTFLGTDSSQEISLVRDDTSLSDDTYTWEAPMDWVIPVATGTTTMRIDVTYKTSTNELITIHTQVTDDATGNKCFHSNTETTLTASWGNITYNVGTTISVNTWTPEIQSGDLGELNK